MRTVGSPRGFLMRYANGIGGGELGMQFDAAFPAAFRTHEVHERRARGFGTEVRESHNSLRRPVGTKPPRRG